MNDNDDYDDDDDEEEGDDEDDADDRLLTVFGAKKVPRVSNKTLTVYREYLVKHLSPGCLVTGIEDFPWEERFVFGEGDPVEYAKLKKTNPSYKDHFRIVDILPQPSPDQDLVAHVERLSDGKQFEIELSYLEAEDSDSDDYMYLEDFSTWKVNW
jgi:hypothetical protein